MFGILLYFTGLSGGLTVTGTGTADSGGIIRNTTSAGIATAATHNLSLTSIRIESPGDQGISAVSLNGTCLLADSTITGFNSSSSANGFDIFNVNGSLAELRIQHSTFSGSPTGGRGINMEASGSASMALVVESGCEFTGLLGDAVAVKANSGSSGTVSVAVKESTFSNAAPLGTGGITLVTTGGPGHFTFNLDTNVFDSIMLPAGNVGAINVAASGGALAEFPAVSGNIRGNTLNNLTGSHGISVTATASSDVTLHAGFTVVINDNVIDRLGTTSKHGIIVDNHNNLSLAHVTVSNNKLGQAANLWTPGPATANAIYLTAGNSGAITASLSGNTIDANTSSFFSVVLLEATLNSALHATVTGNDLQDTDGLHSEFGALTSGGGGLVCVNISGNTLPAAGVGGIVFTPNAGGTINVTQSSAANVSAMNSGATVFPGAATHFGQPACILP